jgi:hypothetical protein
MRTSTLDSDHWLSWTSNTGSKVCGVPIGDKRKAERNNVGARLTMHVKAGGLVEESDAVWVEAKLLQQKDRAGVSCFKFGWVEVICLEPLTAFGENRL